MPQKAMTLRRFGDNVGGFAVSVLVVQLVQKIVKQLHASALCVFGLIGSGTPAPHTAAPPPRIFCSGAAHRTYGAILLM